MDYPHIPVLLDEVLISFSNIKSGYFVDCTLGYGGHSYGILKNYGHIKHIGIDRDGDALEYSKGRLVEFMDKTKFYRGTFASIFPKLKESPLVGILADFGLSSPQLDMESRGFSFNSERLDMRMDTSSDLTAYDVINSYDRESLEYIIASYGEVRPYKRVVDKILKRREKRKIESARELTEIISSTIPKFGRIHPATLVFQAIRIEVNNELKEIEQLLDTIETRAESGELQGTILSLITFHSLEDRLVKQRYKKWAERCICDKHMMRCICEKNHNLGKILNKKPITASKREIKHNGRSRSAKLRSFIFKG